MNASSALSPLLPAGGAGPANGSDAGADTGASSAFAGLLGGGAGTPTPAASAADIDPDALEPEAEDSDDAGALALLAWLPWMPPLGGTGPDAPQASGAATDLPPGIGAGLSGVLRIGIPTAAGTAVDPTLEPPLFASADTALATGMAATTTASVLAGAAAGVQTVAAAQGLTATELAGVETLLNATGEPTADGGAEPLPTELAPSRATSARHGFELSLPTRPAQRFSEALADGVESRLHWMAEQGVGRARIRLSPAELGTIDIQLHLDGKQVRAEFSSANAEVRQALESHLPRLREMFQSQGMTLTQADVGHRQDTRDGPAGSRGDGIASDGEVAIGDSDTGMLAARALRPHSGLLDEYA